MSDLFGLIFVGLMLVAMGLLCCMKVARYNPDGDKCERGVRGGEGLDCTRCPGRSYEVKVYTADGLAGEYLVREGEPEPAELRRNG